MTYPADYSQQLYAYLQAWRQFLEPLTAMAAMAAGVAYPGAPWAAPPYPSPYPAPPTPPTSPVAPPQVPADYTQQLFGHLQGWRQHLEQMTGSKPAPPPYGTDAATPGRRPVPPDPPDAGRTSPPADGPGSLYPTQNTTSVVPPTYAKAPILTQSGSLVPDDHLRSDSLRQAAVVARGPRVAMAPVAELGRMRQRGTASAPITGAPVPTRTVTASAPIQAAVRSNFTGLANRALRNAERG